MDAICTFTELALKNGVRRLVLLSGRGEEEAQLSEQVLQSSEADWTIVRSSWFCQNFSEGFLLDAVLAGEVALPMGDVKEPFVDAEDLADVAVTALTEDGYSGRLYEVTDQRLLTFAEAVAEIAQASSRSVRYVQVSWEEFESMLKAQQVPADFISLVMYLLTTVLDGHNAA